MQSLSSWNLETQLNQTNNWQTSLFQESILNIFLVSRIMSKSGGLQWQHSTWKLYCSTVTKNLLMVPTPNPKNDVRVCACDCHSVVSHTESMSWMILPLHYEFLIGTRFTSMSFHHHDMSCSTIDILLKIY